MKISGRPRPTVLRGCVAGTAGGDGEDFFARGHGRFAPQAEEQRLAAPADVQAGDAAHAGNHRAVRHLVRHGVPVDLQDQVAFPHTRPIRAAAQVDAGHAQPVAVVGICGRRFFDGEAERLLVATETRRGWRRLPGRAGFFQQQHAQLERLVTSPHADAHPLARRRARRQPAQAVTLDHGLTVERGHYVADLQAGARRRAVRGDIGHHDSLAPGHSEALRQLGGHRFLDGDAHVAAHDVAVGGELWSDVAELLDGNGEPDALPGRVYRRVDPDDRAAGVQQRTARVARVDGRIGLDEVVVTRAARWIYVPPSL